MGKKKKFELDWGATFVDDSHKDKIKAILGEYADGDEKVRARLRKEHKDLIIFFDDMN